MIIMTTDQTLKIELLDKLFDSVDVSTLKEFVESEQVVAKLKGIGQNPDFFIRLIREQDTHDLEIMNLKADLASLEGDFRTLLTSLNNTVYSYSPDFNNLKQKHNIF